MAMKPCKECGQPVSTDAKSCPNCGKKNPTGKTSPLAMGCLLLIVLVAVVSVLGKGSPGEKAAIAADSTRNARQKVVDDSLGGPDDHRAAYSFCKEVVTARLKAPSTADFASSPDGEERSKKQHYLIQSHVDAQNSFGAKIRNDFDCRVHETTPDHWVLDKLEMGTRS